VHLNELFLWFLADPSKPRYVGALNLVSAGKGVSLRYGPDWLASGFALSEDLPLTNTEFLPQGRLGADAPRAVGAVDDRFGALGASTSATQYVPRPSGPLPRLEDAQLLSEVAAKVEASESLSALEARIIAGGGSPLGGAKPKALINIGGVAFSAWSLEAGAGL